MFANRLEGSDSHLEPSGATREKTGVSVRLSQQLNPTLYLLSAHSNQAAGGSNLADKGKEGRGFIKCSH